MSFVRNKNVSELLRLAIIGYSVQIAELQSRRAQLAMMIKDKPKRSAVNDIAPKKRRKLSAAARAKIGAAQKARWARDKKENTEKPKPKAEQPIVKIVKEAPIRVKKKIETARPKAAPPKARLIKAALVPIEEKAEQLTPKSTSSTAGLIKTASVPEREKAEQQKPKAAQSTARFLETAPAKSKKYPAEKSKFRSSNYAKAALALQGGGTRAVQIPKPDVTTPAGIVEQLALAGARFRITRGGSLIIGNLGSLPPAMQKMFLEHPNPHLLTAAARHHLAVANQSSK
jgi:hypothetical protein